VVINFEGVACVGGVPEPVEVAALWLRWAGRSWYEVGSPTALIRPPEGTEIRSVDGRIAGIPRAPLDKARPAPEVLGELERPMAGPGFRLVAHGAGAESLVPRRQRKHCPALAAMPWIDTVGMARAVLPRRESYRLEALREHYQIGSPAERHRAGPGVRLATEIFLRLLADGGAPGCWRDLASLEQVAGRAPSCPPLAGGQRAGEVAVR